MKPDLSDAQNLAEYRRELRRYKRPVRIVGIAIVCLGVAGLLYSQMEGPPRPALRTGAWALIALGWLVLFYVIAARTRYHKARMAD
ncbi:MAG: hypothetical protein QOJ94_1076 [Sphingomonadales bacterium]|nr:hypothetical protein [Sphingomonadales bacterium]